MMKTIQLATALLLLPCLTAVSLPQWNEWPFGEKGVDYQHLVNQEAEAYIYREVDFLYYGEEKVLLNGTYTLTTSEQGVPPFIENATQGGNGPGLYYEHCFNGAVKDNWRSSYTPEWDYKHFVNCLSPSGTTLLWPQEFSTWNVESRMTYDLHPNGMQMFFSLTMPQTKAEVRDIAPLNWFGCMWASYTRSFLYDEPVEYFGYDRENGGMGWHTLAANGSIPHWDRGLGYMPAEEGSTSINVHHHPENRFLLPFYYRVVQPEENGQIMIYAMFFNKTKQIRFAVWDERNGQPTGGYALDWHYLVDNPRPNKTYRYKAFLLYEPTELTDRDEIRRYVFSKWLQWYISQ